MVRNLLLWLCSVGRQGVKCLLYWVCLSSITTTSSHRHFSSSWQQFHCLSRAPTHWNGGRLQNKNLSEAQYDGQCVPHCYSLPRQMRKRGVIDGWAKLFIYCFQYMWKASSIINENCTYHMLCSHVDSSTGHSPFDSSSHWSFSLSCAAAQKQQWCPGHLPAQAHRHCCYQKVPRHSRVRRSAVQQAAKAKSSH